MADKEMSKLEPTTSPRTAAKPDTSQIVSAYDWGALGDVIDVGGGDGALLAALLVEYPALRGTVVDLPGTAESARKLLAEAGLADRGNAVAGDVLGTLPAGAEGYLLCSVLHHWDDEQARTILRNCATAAGEAGAVFVIENLAAPTPPTHHTTHALTHKPTNHNDAPTREASTTRDESATREASAGRDDAAVREASATRDGSAAREASAGRDVSSGRGEFAGRDESAGRDDAAHPSEAASHSEALDRPDGRDDAVSRDAQTSRDASPGHSDAARRDHADGRGATGERARDVGELTMLAESAGLAAVAVHTAGTVAIIELAVP